MTKIRGVRHVFFTLVITFGFFTVAFSAEHYRFSNISIEHGLSNLNVTAIAQDESGYLWIGTRRGLNRYDGQEFVHYLYSPSDSFSINSDIILSLHGTENGGMLIGTSRGLNYYDPLHQKFRNIFPFISNAVVQIDKYGEYIYFATSAQGLFRFKPGDENPELVSSHQGKILLSFYIDKDLQVYSGMSNGGGLAIYDKLSESNRYYYFSDSSDSVKLNSINNIFYAADNVLWLGTKSGLLFFDGIHRKYTVPDEYMEIYEKLEGQYITFIFNYKSQYWIGTNSAGLFVYDKDSQIFTNYSKEETSECAHSNSYVSYCTDRSNNLWLGTFDNGLDILFFQTNKFYNDAQLNEITQGRSISSIEKNKDQMFIGTLDQGFYLYDMKNKKSRYYSVKNSDLSYQKVRSALFDSRDRCWIGSSYSLQIFNPENETFQDLELPEPIEGIVDMVETNSKIFLGADYQGLLVYDLDGNILFQTLEYGRNITKIIPYTPSEILFLSFGQGIYSMNIYDFSIEKIDFENAESYPGMLEAITAYIDSTGNLWLGTYHSGLFEISKNKTVIKNYTVQDGLPSNDVLAIIEDENDKLWLSTSFGLARLNISTSTIRKYSHQEGLSNYQFHEKSEYKDDAAGIIYFGGNHGLTYFNPSEMLIDELDSFSIIVEGIDYRNNELVQSNAKFNILGKSKDGKITLGHQQKNFSIHFVAFDFLSPDKIKYYYIMEGLDNKWQEAGNRRSVYYSNMPRGNYVFKVKAKNVDGQWTNNTASLNLKIKPAPWFSAAAWIFYLVFIGFVVFYILRIVFRAALVKKELEIEQAEHERDKEINSMKYRFFTNISHEIRTPLTLINGIVQQIATHENLPDSLKSSVQVTELNISRLLKLMNQLLAFKMMESETLSLWLEKQSINDTIQKILETFKILAENKKITIEFIDENIQDFYFDSDKIEKILTNLLSNALKYTERGGKITVSLKKIKQEKMVQLFKVAAGDILAREYIEISVSDTGCGLSEEAMNKIFDRYTSDKSTSKNSADNYSIGIGLNFTKSLINLHKGDIRVFSKINAGSKFTFTIPFDECVYEPGQFADNDNERKVSEEDCLVPELIQEKIEADFNKYILIIEDDPQLNTFLKNTLRKYYKVNSCFNGEEGLASVKKEHPDVVISDILMPKMNGLELTNILKNSDEFSCIPLILLSSRSEIKDQITGLKYGVDAYIPKPFNVDYLLQTIDTILKNRERINKLFLSRNLSVPEENNFSSSKIHFLSKINEFLDKEIQNPELDVTLLADHLNMSRSSFYRKFKGITKISPVDYIKKYRLTKAIHLINSGARNVGDISELSGYSSLSYFSTVFKTEMDMAPSEYIRQLIDTSEKRQISTKTILHENIISHLNTLL